MLGPFLLLCSQAWRGRLRVPSACIGSRPCHATGLGQPRGCLVVVGEKDAAMPFWVHLMRLVGPDPLERAERRFLYIDGIGCHSDGLIGFKP